MSMSSDTRNGYCDCRFCGARLRHTSDCRQSMFLSSDSAVAIAQVTIDATTTDRVAWVADVGQGEAIECAEVSFDQIQPGSLGRGTRWADAKPLEQREEARVVMQLKQVIHDHEEPLARVAAAQSPEGLEQLGQAFALAKQPVEAASFGTDQLLLTLKDRRATFGLGTCTENLLPADDFVSDSSIRSSMRGANMSRGLNV
jgi:hypothetical protein